MITRQVLIIILCFNLAFPLDSFAASETINPLANLLLQHRDIKSGVGNVELIQKHGKELADATFKLMSDPKNKDFLNSPDGIELKKHQEHLTNYIALEDQFEKCVKDKNAKRKLQDRILQSSFQGMSKLDDSPCLPANVAAVKSFEEFNGNVMKAMTKMVKPDFQNLLSLKVMTNTAKSLLNFRYKFNTDFKGSDSDLDQVVNDVCVRKSQTPKAQLVMTDICEKMDPGFRDELKKELTASMKNLAPTSKISPARALATINSSINRLNATLDKIEVKKDVGYIYDSANLADHKSREDFDTYVNQYSQEVSTNAGTLLLTSTMKDKAGTIKSFNDADTKKNIKTTQFEFVKHNNVTMADITASIKEAETKMLNAARDTLTIAHQATMKKNTIRADEDDIAELVKINPFAAGQILIKNPEYAGLMCESINKINESDVRSEDIDKYFLYGSAIVGGALVLTGVGAVAGAYMITGSVTAGLAAGTAAGSILGYSALAGSAVEMVSLGYYGKRAADHYYESNQLEAAYMTKNTDAKAITEAKNELIEFKEARLMAGISLASMGFNLVNVGNLLNVFKSGTMSARELGAATKILKVVGDTKVAQKLSEIVKALGAAGAEKLDNFLLLLARAGEAGRIKFLELLMNGRLTPEKYKDIIESSLLAAKNCSKV